MPRENTIHDYTIEPPSNGVGVVVWGHGEYGESSVLAGAPLRQLMESFPTLEEAQAEWPGAEVLDHSTRVPYTLPPTPPAWFDPADAGEQWDEDW